MHIINYKLIIYKNTNNNTNQKKNLKYISIKSKSNKNNDIIPKNKI